MSLGVGPGSVPHQNEAQLLMANDPNADALGRNRCVDCGTLSPKTDTNYTLISARHGWRLTRQVDANGRNVLEWRCPRCWEKYRKRDTV